MKDYWLKKVAIILTCFPGSLLLIAVLNYLIMGFVESSRSVPGDPNIGAGLLVITALINIPTLIMWLLYLLSTLRSNS